MRHQSERLESGDRRGPTLRAELYEELLAAAPPVGGTVLEALEAMGISEEVAVRAGMRQGPAGVDGVHRRMEEAFGHDALKEAGLWSESRGAPRLAPLSGVSYVLIPFHRGGRVVFFTARPLVPAEDQKALAIPPGVMPKGGPPGFYGLDEALETAGPVLIVQTELGALQARAAGYTAVACMDWKRIEPEWIRPLEGRRAVALIAATRYAPKQARELRFQLRVTTQRKARVRVLPRGRSIPQALQRHSLTKHLERSGETLAGREVQRIVFRQRPPERLSMPAEEAPELRVRDIRPWLRD